MTFNYSLLFKVLIFLSFNYNNNVNNISYLFGDIHEI